MTAQELVEIAQRGRPTVRYRAHANGTAVGAWSEEHQRWITVAGLLLTGQWASMPVEILVNSKPMVDQAGYLNQ